MKLTQPSFKKNVVYLLSTLVFLSLISTAYAASPDEWRCGSYARDAVEQNKQNITAACGFTGLRWNNDEAGQKQWCLKVVEETAEMEKNIRQDMLAKCFTKKSSLSNPENQPNIPKACQDPSKTYTAIRKIYSSFRYDKNLHTVVNKNGLIRYDFNGDGQSDYVFTELNTQSNLRLLTCFSHPSGNYQRVLSNMNFYTDSSGLSTEQYNVTLRNGLLHIDIDYFGHNEGSCSSRGSYAYKKDQQRFIIVDSDSGCSPVIDSDGQPYPLSPPTLLKMY